MILLENEEKNLWGVKPAPGPSIDVVAPLSANLLVAKTLLNDIQEYAEDIEKISVAMKGVALMNSNMYAYTSAQSAIDVTKDVLDLIGGKKITTIAEMQEKLKKEEEELKKKVVEDGQHPNNY